MLTVAPNFAVPGDPPGFLILDHVPGGPVPVAPTRTRQHLVQYRRPGSDGSRYFPLQHWVIIIESYCKVTFSEML